MNFSVSPSSSEASVDLVQSKKKLTKAQSDEIQNKTNNECFGVSLPRIPKGEQENSEEASESVDYVNATPRNYLLKDSFTAAGLDAEVLIYRAAGTACFESCASGPATSDETPRTRREK